MLNGFARPRRGPTCRKSSGPGPAGRALLIACLVWSVLFLGISTCRAWQLQVEKESPAGGPAQPGPPPAQAKPEKEEALDLFGGERPKTPPRPAAAPSPQAEAPGVPAPPAPGAQGKKQKVLWSNWNGSPCQPAEKAEFSLGFPRVVSELHTACRWPRGKSSLPYRLTSGGRVYGQGAMRKGPCTPGQEEWCLAQAQGLDLLLPGGDYSLELADLCDNSQAGRVGLLAVLGRAPQAGRKVPPVKPGKVLLSQKLNPSDKPQSVSFQELTVTVPGGLLQQAQEVTVREPSGPVRSLLGPDSLVLAAYDISLGRRHRFEQPITLEIKFDPQALGLEPGDESRILGYRWDAEREQWLVMPSRVDLAQGRIITSTRQLSAKQWLVKGLKWVGNTGKKIVKGVQDRLQKALRPARPWVRWAGDLLWYNTVHRLDRAHRDLIKRQSLALTKAHGELFYVFYDRAFLESGPECNSKTWKPLKDPAKYSKSISTYAQDINFILQDALHAYDKAGLGKPPTPIVVDLDSSLIRGTKNRGAYEYYYNRIHLKSDGGQPKSKKTKGSAYAPDYVKQATAHELFHGVQASTYIQKGLMHYFYHPYSPAVDPYLWWIEACAEYAANQVAFKLPKKLMGHRYISPKLLSFPLEYTGLDPANPSMGEIEYDRGFLVDYLARQKGVSFKGLHLELAKDLTGKHPLVRGLDRYLRKASGKGLLEHYSRFAAWFYFSRESPIAPVHRPDGSSRDFLVDLPNYKYQIPIFNYQSGKRVVSRSAGKRTPKLNQVFNIKPGYVAQLWAVIPKPAPAGQRSFQRMFRISSQSQEPDTWFGVFVLPQNNWLKGEVKPLGEIKMVRQDVFATLVNGPKGQNDGLYVLGINSSLERPRMAAIEVAETGVDLDVKSLAPLKNQYGAQCEIEGKAYNLPQMKKAEYVVKDFTMRVKFRGPCQPKPNGEFRFSFGDTILGHQQQYYVFINDLSGKKPRMVSYGACVVISPLPKPGGK